MIVNVLFFTQGIGTSGGQSLIGNLADDFGGWKAVTGVLFAIGVLAFLIILKLQIPRIGEASVEAENILDGRPAELVNGLVIVTHHHQVMVPAGQNDCQLQLCLVCILILIDADVAEFLLIVFPDVVARAEQAHCLHDDVIKVHRVGARQLGGILPVNGSDLPCPVIGTSRLGGILRRAQFILLAEIEAGILPEFITDPCPPYRMLAITFTNKAAGEIRERLVKQAL